MPDCAYATPLHKQHQYLPSMGQNTATAALASCCTRELQLQLETKIAYSVANMQHQVLRCASMYAKCGWTQEKRQGARGRKGRGGGKVGGGGVRGRAERKGGVGGGGGHHAQG